MTGDQPLPKVRKNGQKSAGRAAPAKPTGGQHTASRSGAVSRGPGRQKRKSRFLSPDNSRRPTLSVANPEIYRPLKKPITLRVDADVLAWFKKDGRRYQTRINQALRKIMERQMKGTSR